MHIHEKLCHRQCIRFQELFVALLDKCTLILDICIVRIFKTCKVPKIEHVITHNQNAFFKT